MPAARCPSAAVRAARAATRRARGRVVLVGGDQRADLRDDRAVEPLAARERAHQRLARRRRLGLGAAWARARRAGGGAAGAAARRRPANSRRDEAPAEAPHARGAHARIDVQLRRGCSSRKPSRSGEVLVDRGRQPDHL